MEHDLDPYGFVDLDRFLRGPIRTRIGGFGRVVLDSHGEVWLLALQILGGPADGSYLPLQIIHVDCCCPPILNSFLRSVGMMGLPTSKVTKKSLRGKCLTVWLLGDSMECVFEKP